MDRPKKLVDLINLELIENLALPSNYRYGKAIFERGAVEIIEQSDLSVEGWAGGLPGKSAEGGGQRRRVKLTSTPKGLAWHCAGNPKIHDIFCKHCTALALFITQRKRDPLGSL